MVRQYLEQTLLLIFLITKNNVHVNKWINLVKNFEIKSNQF